jgi:hypothetical protein
MKKVFVYGIVLPFILSQSMSCSKKSSSTPTCKINAITANNAGNNATVAITYNDAGQLSTIVESSTTYTSNKVYAYSGNVVLVTTTTSGSSDITTDSIVVNGDGLMVSDLNRSSGNVSLTTYTYSGTELISLTNQVGNNPGSTINYTWSNGDMQGYTGYNLSYNDKPSQAGDYIQIQQLLEYGLPIIKTAHQCTAATINGSIQNFNYTYDNSGKITQMVITGGASSTATYNYSYDCNQ